MSKTLRDAYDDVDKKLLDAIQERRGGKGPPVLAGIRIQALDAYADKPWGWNPITAPSYDDNGNCVGSEVVCIPEDLGEDHEDAKDAEMLRIVKSELKQGRKCCIYPQFTGKHDVRPKLQKLLLRNKIRAWILPDTVLPAAREDWIMKHEHEIDVLIVHPKRVMTGLDLIWFPSLIWYQLGYSTHVLRQGSCRARRPIQTLPCKVFFLYYKNTVQEQALGIMGEKEAASQALEGTFDIQGLNNMMNGGEDSDIMAALAHSIGSKRIDVKAAWAKVAAFETQLTRPALPPTRTTPQIPLTSGNLFDFADPVEAKLESLSLFN